MITVKNDNRDNMDVAISKWDNSGSSDFYTISPGKQETWDRSDKMGFVMVVTNADDSRKSGTYWFVKHDSSITITSLNHVEGAIMELHNPYESY